MHQFGNDNKIFVSGQTILDGVLHPTLHSSQASRTQKAK